MQTSFNKHIVASIVSMMTLSVWADDSATTLRINEIMQSNVGMLMVEHNYPDSWVELHNPTAQTINLKGWAIGPTDDLVDAYHFEHTTVLEPDSYSLVYCDRKNNSHGHTHFRLESTSKGRLYLWNGAGQLVDSLAYPKMLAPNVAYARCEDGAWIHPVVATPEACNSQQPGVLLPDPVFSTAGKLLQEGEALELSINVPADAELPADTRLCVTTDGSMPTPEKATLDARGGCTMMIDGTKVVRAQLFSTEAITSMPVTHSYILHPRATTLPILSLATDSVLLYSDENGIMVGSDWNGNCYNDWRRPLNIEYFEQDSLDAIINQMGETRTHGMGSLLFSQKSLNLYANKRFGKKKFDTSTFWPDKLDLTRSETFCIRNGGNRCIDTRFEDAFVQLLFARHLDTLQYLAYRPVIAYINGQYRGLYGLRERSHASWVENNMGIDEHDVCVVENFYSPMDEYSEHRAVIDDPNSTYADFARLFDMPLLLNYLCAETYSTNSDYPHNNVWMWRDATDPTDPLHPLLKDLDYFSRTKKSNWFNMILIRKPESANVVNADRHKLFIRLLGMPAFLDPFLDRMQTYLGDFCKPSVTVAMVNQMRAEIDAEIAPTFALMSEGVTYDDFERTMNERLIPYCEQWPRFLCECMSISFGLGNVLELKVDCRVLDTEGRQEPEVTVNDIRLTEGDFDGCCYDERRTLIDSGSEDYGWLLTATMADGTEQNVQFLSPRLRFTPNEDAPLGAQSLHFSLLPLEHQAIAEVVADTPSAACCYDLMGRKVSGRTGIFVRKR